MPTGPRPKYSSPIAARNNTAAMVQKSQSDMGLFYGRWGGFGRVNFDNRAAFGAGAGSVGGKVVATREALALFDDLELSLLNQ